jgi:hypothetical protein
VTDTRANVTATPPPIETKRARLAPIAVFLALSAPILAVLAAGVPPLVDYPNHLSRLWLEGGGATVAPVSSMYRIVWDTLTNIGIDLLAIIMIPLFGYEIVGRIFVAAAIFLPAAGGVLLWRVLHGRFHWWQISFALLAWNMGLVMGFLNFEIGLGVALLAVAADPMLSQRGVAVSTIARAALAGLLLLIHVFALVFYAALFAGLILGPEFSPLMRRGALIGVSKSLLTIGGTLALPALAILLASPSLPGRQTGANLLTIWSDFQVGFGQTLAAPVVKIRLAFVGIDAYAGWLDALTFAAIALPIIFSAISRRLTAHAGMLLVAGGLFACYFIFPQFLAGTAWVDRRFALMALLVLVLALRPDLPVQSARTLAALLLAVSLVRTSVIGWIWHERQADVAALSRALAAVPAGAAILPLEHEARKHDAPIGRYTALGEPTYRHLVTLALPWRHAFTPNLFAARGKQPVQILQPWSEIAEPDGGLLASVNALTTPPVYDEAVKNASYLKVWRDRFDFAVVVNADVADVHGQFVPPEGLELLKDEGFAQLYRITRQRP